MRFGFGRLRLSADQFWAMTPTELAAAAREHFTVGAAPLDRQGLGELLARYPDRQEVDDG